MILRIFISFVLFWQTCAYQGGQSDSREERFLFSSFMKIRELYRDIKGHSNNKVIINFGTKDSYFAINGCPNNLYASILNY